MSDHSQNPRSIAAATLPSLLPVGVVAGVTFQVQVDSQSNVLLLPSERIRRLADSDSPLILVDDVWQAPPEGAYVHELGKPLPPEHCDAVVILCTVAQDTLDRPILTPGGAATGNSKISMQPHRVLMRMPLVEFQRFHMAQLRGVQS